MTGVKKSQICRKYGMTNMTSRYRTLRAASPTPRPNARRHVSARKTSARADHGDGAVWYHAKRPTRITAERTKSTIGVTTDASGNSKRGKYAFVTSAALPTTLPALLESADWK